FLAGKLPVAWPKLVPFGNTKLPGWLGSGTGAGKTLFPVVDKFSRFVRLNKLKKSARNWKVAPSPPQNQGIFVFLKALKSTSAYPGPMKVLRPRVPFWPRADVVKSEA